MKQVGIGTRVINFLVDTIAIFAIAYIATKINQYFALQHRAIYIRFGYVFFACLFAYYFICEALFARTLGKLVSLTKVVTNSNNKPNVLQILLRSLVRLTIIDMFFIPFLNDKTLHDYISKTNVVEI
ncbi:MAG: RDD family protein [Chitinophagaceae bacterium]